MSMSVENRNTESRRGCQADADAAPTSAATDGAVDGAAEVTHIVTWKQLAMFAEQIDRTPEHVYRVVRGEYRGGRRSEAIGREFRRCFGFDMDQARFAGAARPVRPVTRRVDGSRIR